VRFAEATAVSYPFLGTSSDGDWREWTHYGVEESEGVVTLAPAPAGTYDRPVSVPRSGEGPLAEAVDVDADDCGTVYVLSAGGGVTRYDPETDRLSRVPCVGDDESESGEATSLCVDGHSVYVAFADGRVSAYSRTTFGRRWTVTGAFERPRRLVEHCDRVYLVDAGPADGDADGFVARLRDDGRVERLVERLDSPTDAGFDAEGRLSILVEGPAVQRYTDSFDADGTGGVSSSDVVVASTGRPVPLTCLVVEADGELVAGQADDDVVSLLRYVRTRGGFVRIVGFARPARNMRRWHGTRRRPGGLYVVAADGSGVWFLPAATGYASTVGGSSSHDGRLVARFDSGESGTVWHRLTAAFDLAGPGTQVRVSYAPTDDASEFDDLESIPGVGETYARRLRAGNVATGRELLGLSVRAVAGLTGAPEPVVADWFDHARTAAPSDELRWHSFERPNPSDALFDGTEGRYLWVSVRLVGTDRASPRLHAARVYFPRQSYLRYLPSVYHEDERSVAFLERFLSAFESTYVSLEEETNHLTRYLDPRGTPATAVAWLGEWLGLEFDESLSEADRRDVLAAAPDLFKMRGTRAGLFALLSHYLGDRRRPRTSDAARERATEREREALDGLVEAGHLTPAEREDALAAHADTVEWPDPSVAFVWEFSDWDCVDSTTTLERFRGVVRCPPCFVVLLAPPTTDEQVRTVRRLVDGSVPAHTTGRVVPLRSRFQLDGDTYLGVNSELRDPQYSLGETDLGVGTVLGTREPAARLGLNSLDREYRLS
jgi:phage tail-like protein